jgi:hypothetical protein
MMSVQSQDVIAAVLYLMVVQHRRRGLGAIKGTQNFTPIARAADSIDQPQTKSRHTIKVFLWNEGMRSGTTNRTWTRIKSTIFY